MVKRKPAAGDKVRIVEAGSLYKGRVGELVDVRSFPPEYIVRFGAVRIPFSAASVERA